MSEWIVQAPGIGAHHIEIWEIVGNRPARLVTKLARYDQGAQPEEVDELARQLVERHNEEVS